jgi:hypothetical protein
MNDDKTITAAIETSNVTALLAAYRKFTSSSGATTDEFFRFITIRETELLPIPFLYPDGALKVVAAGIETSLSGTAGQPVALNLYRLRKKLFQTNQKLASVFDIYSGSTKSCTIVITPGTVSRERYLLEFLNSYGAYERIEVTGIGNIESEIESDSTYQIYDESIDDYIEARERQSARDKLLVESGYRNTEELVHLMDMLASDELSSFQVNILLFSSNRRRNSRLLMPPITAFRERVLVSPWVFWTLMAISVAEVESSSNISVDSLSRCLGLRIPERIS